MAPGQHGDVKAEIARRVSVVDGLTKDWGTSRLREYEAMAYANQDYVAGASITMDAMRLGGHITEKREVKTLTDGEGEAIRRLVSESLKAAPTG